MREENLPFSKFVTVDYEDSPQDFKSELKVHEITIINSLNEPIFETIKRDFLNIQNKLEAVLFPYKRTLSQSELRRWDLWGPMLFCMLLAFTLSISHKSEADVLFATIFVLIWIGASVITINTKLLGSTISFFQSISLIGYCVFPISMATFVIAMTGSFLPSFFKVCLVLGSMIWSIASSLAYLTNSIPKEKLILAIYPIFLFFGFLSWFAVLM